MARTTAAFAALIGIFQFASFANASNYEINVVLPLTGRTSFLGQSEQKALQLLEKVVNRDGGIEGQELRFIFHDDQSSPQVAVQLASQVIRAKPAVVIGSAQVAMCNAMAPLMKNGPVMYCTSPGIHPKPGEYVFTSSVSTHDLAGALIRYYRLKGWSRIALITTTDATGQDAERGINEVLAQPENSTIKLVENTHFNPGDVSVAAQIEQIKASNAQAMIAWTTGASVGTVFKAIAQAGLDIPVATTDGNMTHAQMTQYADFLPKQLFIPASEWPSANQGVELSPEVERVQKEFFQSFAEQKMQPDAASTFSWDPGLIVVSAIRSLGVKATATELRTYIAELKNFAGVNGVYDFVRTPQRGLDESATIITLWNPSKGIWEVVSKPTGIPLK